MHFYALPEQFILLVKQKSFAVILLRKPFPAPEYKHSLVIHGHTAGRCIDGQRYAHARKTTSQRESQKSPIEI